MVDEPSEQELEIKIVANPWLGRVVAAAIAAGAVRLSVWLGWRPTAGDLAWCGPAALFLVNLLAHPAAHGVVYLWRWARRVGKG